MDAKGTVRTVSSKGTGIQLAEFPGVWYNASKWAEYETPFEDIRSGDLIELSYTDRNGKWVDSFKITGKGEVPAPVQTRSSSTTKSEGSTWTPEKTTSVLRQVVIKAVGPILAQMIKRAESNEDAAKLTTLLTTAVEQYTLDLTHTKTMADVLNPVWDSLSVVSAVSSEGTKTRKNGKQKATTP